MRGWAALGLLAAVAAIAGCGTSPPPREAGSALSAYRTATGVCDARLAEGVRACTLRRLAAPNIVADRWRAPDLKLVAAAGLPAAESAGWLTMAADDSEARLLAVREAVTRQARGGPLNGEGGSAYKRVQISVVGTDQVLAVTNLDIAELNLVRLIALASGGEQAGNGGPLQASVVAGLEQRLASVRAEAEQRRAQIAIVEQEVAPGVAGEPFTSGLYGLIAPGSEVSGAESVFSAADGVVAMTPPRLSVGQAGMETIAGAGDLRRTIADLLAAAGRGTGGE